MSKRTDLHRVGAIVPEDYVYVLSYALPTTSEGHPVPGIGIDCQVERRQYNEKGEVVAEGEHNKDGRCCLASLRGLSHAEHGGAGRCTVCGAGYIYGDVWRHEPTGEHIHVGHTCAEKYRLLANRNDFDARLDSHRRAAAARRLAEERRAECEAFLAKHAGLAEALQVQHLIVCDIAAKLKQFRSLSEKQIALVFKLADEARNPKPAETTVPAPEGRQVVRGTVVSVKCEEGMYGDIWRMTVKVETSEGSWLAWGTCPRSLTEVVLERSHPNGLVGVLKGAEVELTATLKRGRDSHFALMSRPSKARVVRFAGDVVAKAG